MLEIVGDTQEPGAIVAGAYRLERILGEGGMGVVWEGVELATERRVALKFLQQRREADSRNQERVLREARATMAIVHPNVAAIHAVLETDAGVPFLVMDVLVGETLRTRLQGRGTLNYVQCARIMRAVVAAVAAAHAKRIVHRDLKPDNVFLLREPPDDVRVIDFGIAKHLPHVGAESIERDLAPKPSLTSTGAVLGTPVYMAPEQIFGDDDIDGRADVWSLGIMLYECLAGRRPTDGEGFGRIIRRITTDPIEPLDRARPGLPQRLTSLVGRMLSRDRAARPSLEEIGSVLESLEARDANAPPSAQPERPTDKLVTTASNVALGPSPNGVAAKRSGWRLVGGAAAALVVTAGVGLTAWRLRADHATVVLPPVSSAAPSASIDPARLNETSNLMVAALAALKARDGVTCLRDLDAYDASPLLGAFPRTTDPEGGLGTRAMCTMVAGDCPKGKAQYRSWLAATMKGNTNATPELLASSLDTVVGGYCEGNGLTPNDRLLRAAARLNEGGTGLRVATSAECKEWIATEDEQLPSIDPNSFPASGPPLMRYNLGANATRCYAHAGDCKSALSAYREDFRAKYARAGEPAADAEKRMLSGFDAIVTGTSCVAKR